MDGPQPLTATKLAVYQHFSCDLYIHNIYHRRNLPGQAYSDTAHHSGVTKALFERGLDWETSLFSWLDRSNLLLKLPSIPVEADSLLQNILADDRSHFFIAGLTFQPPQLDLGKRFTAEQTEPLVFGLSKPDLLEITKSGNNVIWRVVDAKVSKNVKVSHYTQVYFYTLCLTYLLRDSPFQSSDMAGIWLPTSDDLGTFVPSTNDIEAISISLLAPAMDNVLFKQLPKALTLPFYEVKWHFNPLCRGCRYEPECRIRALGNGELGSMPNISIEDAKVLKDLLCISRASGPPKLTARVSDIEDLHVLLQDHSKFHRLSQSSPNVIKRAKGILGIPKKVSTIDKAKRSPVVEASRSQEVHIVSCLNYTCPSREDIAVLISVVIDPSSQRNGTYFCVTAHTLEAHIITPSVFFCSSHDFIANFANFIRSIESSHPGSSGNTCQIYVWSSDENLSLQSTIIEAALTSSASHDDISLCISVLAEGASLLRTTFQPDVLSGALLLFLAKGKRREVEYRACLERMGLSTGGTCGVMRKRIENEIQRLKKVSSTPVHHEAHHKELGQLHRVVVLKKEIERQLALPIPGYWDLSQCLRVLLPTAPPCPSDDEIFAASKTPEKAKFLGELLLRRNQMVFQTLIAFRARLIGLHGASYLVNEAKILPMRSLDICKEVHLRKLFFMQQFEVLAKLTEFWQSRISGCPDVPLLQFCKVVQGSTALEYVFNVVSGSIDIPAFDRDFPFFDKLLVLDASSLGSGAEDIPVEALFDDLEVSGMLFPLNQYTKGAWTKQDVRVQEEIMVADVRNVKLSRDSKYTMVTLRVWGTCQAFFKEGRIYRLSPRFVDFNTAKILSMLFEIDLSWDLKNRSLGDGLSTHYGIPFLQLIIDPGSFGRLPMAEQYLESEIEIQQRFGVLRALGNILAGSLVFKPSQHKALQQILSDRLSVIWGPPGTGKTHTISLSLLRLIAVERRHHGPQSKIIFVTATTHAAIEGCRTKIMHLMDTYRSVASSPEDWLDDIQVQIVSRGNDHPPPQETGVHIYAGTIYQLHTFAKKNSIQIDCVVIDEAGQVSLGSISLVLRFLSPKGRIIISGDPEQLAPILNAQYPKLKSPVLFGSILDCLMRSESTASLADIAGMETPRIGIVQLIENFRLNADLGDFISTIYSCPFKPQKAQPREFAEALSLAEIESDRFRKSFPAEVLVPVRTFLVSLAGVMLRKGGSTDLAPPARFLPSGEAAGGSSGIDPTHRPVSLTMIRLQSWSSQPRDIPYEEHVHLEAAVASALVHLLRACCPDEDIFVATPHRIQREAVKAALAKVAANESVEELFGQMSLESNRAKSEKVTVDTIERLQGSEASLVICLFSAPKSFRGELGFLLDRRRLNVAISRARTLCILICSDETLCPPLKNLANSATAKGYGFLKAYQERAWSYYLPLQTEKVL